MRILFFIPILLLLLSACEKEANIKLPVQEPKLAVSCFISPGDSAVVVTVYLSEPVFAEQVNTLVSNATLTLSNGITSINIPYNNNSGNYQASLAVFPIMHNSTYYLTVVDATGRRVSSQTTVPSASNPAYDVSQTATTDPYDNITYQVNCTVHDISGEENYYRVNAASVYYSASVMDTSIYMEGRTVYLNDRSKDGTDMNAGIQVYSYGNDLDTASYRARRVIVVKGNKDYYNFHNSVSTAEFSNGNPFAEPVIIYSNIEGGYGCFGAFTLTYKEIPY